MTTYPDETFSNLWLIRLDDAGRCREFTEWWMTQDDSTTSETLRLPSSLSFEILLGGYGRVARTGSDS